MWSSHQFIFTPRYSRAPHGVIKFIQHACSSYTRIIIVITTGNFSVGLAYILHISIETIPYYYLMHFSLLLYGSPSVTRKPLTLSLTISCIFSFDLLFSNPAHALISLRVCIFLYKKEIKKNRERKVRKRI